MKLYQTPLSGHCHRVRLFLSLLGIEHQLVEVNLARGEHKRPEFLKLNPFGQVPVLDDGGVVIGDSNAILVYLSRKYGRDEWLPQAPVEAAAVQKWLSVAAGQLAYGPAAARLVKVFGARFNAEEVIARAHALLKLMDGALTGQDWLVGSRPTLADVALYSYISSAPEGDVDLSGYAQVCSWLQRVESLPGFVPFRKTMAGLAA